ncbi:ionotropic receptor 93a [Sitophilus oryzae]|uniref:Ionotropic receptor 93a n=1 Tax=Sitophilus oryzae TaxID=7048 RepID=A0A6J2XFV2_SITOR|nr:ionotropic receptor 93a [Sitophilus oryzae]
MFINVVVALCFVLNVVKSETFPSLLTTNATIAIVIDKEYLPTEYDEIKSKIEEYLVYAKREILRHGGVNVQFYAWTAINVKRDLTAILSITSCAKTWALFKASETENLLHMAISEQDCARLPQNEAITIPIIDKGQETPQMLLDLRTIGVYKWKKMIIIYDNKVSDDMITRIIRSVTKQANRIGASGISLMKLFSSSSLSIEEIRSNFKEKLSTIDPKTVGGNFLVIVSFEFVEIIMEYAKELKLVDTLNQWLYVISDTTNKITGLMRFKRLLKEGDNVAFIYNNTISKKSCKGGMMCHIEEILAGFTKSLDSAIVDEFETAAQVSEEEWEAIRPTKQDRKNDLLEKMKKYLTDYGVCDNCTTWKFETGETWGREYLDSIRSEHSIAEILQVGSWRPSDGPTMSDELFPHISHGFRGKTLPVVSFHNPPWQILKVNESGDVIEYSGIVFDIMRELSKNLNFTFNVEIVKSHFQYNVTRYNPKNETTAFLDVIESSGISTYTVPQEILELVHNKSVAMGACAFTVTEENKKLINFTSPISIQFYTFLVARPRELSRALLFISPFTGGTWLCLAATIISMGPILYCIHKYSPVYEYKGIRGKGGLATIQNCIWYMYGALLQQGGMHLPYADSARILIGSWWLVVLVIGTSYCGNLVAFLTFPKIDIPITTIDELIQHVDTLTWSYGKNTFLEAQLQVTKDKTYRIIYEHSKDVTDKRNMINLIKAGKHVHIDWKIKLQYIMKQQFQESDTCDLALGADEFFDEQIALIVSPDTPYLNKINTEIKKLHQVGLIQKWLEDYLPKKDKCWKKKRSVEVNNHTVNLDDMQGSFFILALGFLLSFIVIFTEKLWWKKVTNKENNSEVQPFTT